MTMGERNRSFWSTVPGLVTGMAGLLTAIVGFLTVSVQLGWIGGGKASNDKLSSTTTTVASSSSTSSSSATAGIGTPGVPGSTGSLSIQVEPQVLNFSALAAADKTLTITNRGSGDVSVLTPIIEGTGAAQFQVDDTDCTRAPLAPRDKCELKVTFTPSGLAGGSSATLDISLSGGDRPTTVALRAGIL